MVVPHPDTVTRGFSSGTYNTRIGRVWPVSWPQTGPGIAGRAMKKSVIFQVCRPLDVDRFPHAPANKLGTAIIGKPL